ncbi:S-layer homology domain-containing protein [Saccharibacillus deserti]|uniref:S-layer homology domain-containing protein n=1 Tax=Saccharibacillus deserti TaxID=1634444 RepID=UPI001551C157|nr:S-layer homology domain-containing protein [Saccharibacillus deserti]
MRKAVRSIPLLLAIMLIFSLLHPALTPASAAPEEKWITYKIDSFADTVMVDKLFSLNGATKVATVDGGQKVLRLTERTGNQFGTAFNKTLIAAGNNYSFSTFFKFRLNDKLASGSPADGITFTVQAQSNNAGAVGVGIGYGGIKPSFAVKYDTYQNGDKKDPSNNYIGLAVNGDVANNNPSWYKTLPEDLSLSGGEDLYSWIDYNGKTQTVEVYISKTEQRPAEPSLKTTGINLNDIFKGNSGVYAGFTSATGGSMETHDIHSWYFANELDPIDPAAYTYKQAPIEVQLELVPVAGQPGKYTATATPIDVLGNPVPGAPVTFTSVGKVETPSQNANENGTATTIVDFGTSLPSGGEVRVVSVGGAYDTAFVPPAPVLSAVPETVDQLRWTSVPGAVSYNLYKDGVQIETGLTGTTHTVDNGSLGDLSLYTVTAVAQDGTALYESIPSNETALGLSLDFTLEQPDYTMPIGAERDTVVRAVYGDPQQPQWGDVTAGSQFYANIGEPTLPGSKTDPKVVTFDEKGHLIAVGAGTTVIEAVYEDKRVQSVVTVIIAPPVLDAGQETPTTALLTWNEVPGAQSYNVYDANGSPVASGINGSEYRLTGLTPETTRNYIVKAVSNGLESVASNSVSVTTPVQPPSKLRDLLIDPSTVTMTPGDTQTPKVTAVYLEDESIKDVTGQAVYTSADPSIATVDASGKVTAVSPGTTTVTAVYDGKTVTQTVIVQNAAPAYTIDLTVSPERVMADGTSKVTASAKAVDSQGRPAAGIPVTFTLDNGDTVGTGVTGEDGTAVIEYTPAKLTDTTPVHRTITASAKDSNGLTVADSAGIDYYPAMINGVVIDHVTQKPVSGAKIRVAEDFDGDGIVDFAADVTTDANGEYAIAVPRGNYAYTLNTETPVTSGGTTFTLKQTETVTVGTLQTGDTIEPVNAIAGQIFIVPQAGSTESPAFGDLFGGAQTAVLTSTDGSFQQNLPIAADGSFKLTGVPQGSYRIAYLMTAPNGEHLAGPPATVNIVMNEDGQLGIVYSLIDPYGTVRDASTGQVIAGADVTLYWADTPGNAAAGRAANTPVPLPTLAGFAPNNNINPQSTSTSGEYAWMVYPEGDYYIVATRSGYETYDTRIAKPNRPAAPGEDSYIQNGIIHVGQTIVNFDFNMQPLSVPSTPSTGGGSPLPPPAAVPAGNLSLNISTDSSRVPEGGTSTITVDYANKTNTALNGSTVTVTLPEGVEVVDANGGTVNGRTITWNVASLPAGGTGSFKVSLKWGQIDAAQAARQITGQFVPASGTVKASDAAVAVQVFSDRFGSLSHQRYILGYPDKKFHPTDTLTRAELAAIVARLSENASTAGSVSFKDVRSGHWAANYIRIATAQGYFAGYADGTFKPDAPVARGELAVVLARFLDLDTSDSLNAHFTDLNGNWAAGAVEALFRSGQLSGYPDGTFKPGALITREEAVTLINRALYRGPLAGLTPQFPDVAESRWSFGDVQEATLSHESVSSPNGGEIWQKTIQDNMR